MLVDAGALIALLDANEDQHESCVAVVATAPDKPMVTTWPCFTEAMYVLFRKSGHQAQSRLWVLWSSQRLLFHDLSGSEIDRCAELMSKYRDLPMDLADATLVVAAETLGIREVFTLDRHFRAYRTTDDQELIVVP